MIQAVELRVGNLLKDYKHKLQYVEVHTINRYDHTQCKVTEHTGGYVYECSLEDLRPIKLTPEILKKAGFKRGVFSSHKSDIELLDVGLMNNKGHPLPDFGVTYPKSRRALMFVHELQNFWYWFTDEELNIEL